MRDVVPSFRCTAGFIGATVGLNYFAALTSKPRPGTKSLCGIHQSRSFFSQGFMRKFHLMGTMAFWPKSRNYSLRQCRYALDAVSQFKLLLVAKYLFQSCRLSRKPQNSPFRICADLEIPERFIVTRGATRFGRGPADLCEGFGKCPACYTSPLTFFVSIEHVEGSCPA